MSLVRTVVFADLTGSTGVFEELGNALATEAITTMTQWIASVCEAHQGRVVKMLGDGVLVVFEQPVDALAAVVELQRVHERRIQEWPNHLRMRLQVGVATGEVIEVEGDSYGDAVNVASRLSDLSGPDKIWVTANCVQNTRPAVGVRYRNLGPISIRGKVEPMVVYQVEWHEDTQTHNLTVPAAFVQLPTSAPSGARIKLSWLDQSKEFRAAELPVYLGRGEAEFVVNDPRVSRQHAKLQWRNGSFVLTDMSTYGTWVRFADSTTDIALRRDDCILLSRGEIALGAPFEDFTVPTVSFEASRGDS